ncbi:MAG: polymerase/3-5 exonuclease PolX [Bacilli bacterium]|nr:polymerase/3-5 exonuclease PolX [Bacilli bacterium]
MANPVSNTQIAFLLRHLAGMLEIVGEQDFKVRAFERAATAVLQSKSSMEELVKERRIHLLQGVGRGIAEVISEYVETGESTLLHELEQQIPAELQEILLLPGIGPKSLQRFQRELGIRSLDDLQNACESHRVRALSGFGAQKEERILETIKSYRSAKRHISVGIVYPFAELLVNHLTKWEHVNHATIVGSVRRMTETVQNVNLLAAASINDHPHIIERFVQLPLIKVVHEQKDDYCSTVMQVGKRDIPVDLRLVSPNLYGLAMIQYTGSTSHVASLVQRVKPDESNPDTFTNETDTYQYFGLPWIPPELREGTGEIEESERGSLPELVNANDIRGDLHVHTNWSDGDYSLEDVARMARTLGYHYIAITDHSRSLAIASGLTIEAIKRQQDQIRKLNLSWNDFSIFAGVELEILADGSLDYPDEVLAELDFVVASVHSAFKQSQEQMTARLVAAIRNPFVHLIGHPSGRLLSRRPSYAFHLDEVLHAAADTGTAVELNCSPNRLDLNEHSLRKAKQYGVKVAINTDFHHRNEFLNMRIGVGMARRAWLAPQEVINTCSVSEVMKFAADKKNRVGSAL